MIDLAYAIQCEGLHFLLGFSVGLLVFLWTWIILSRVWSERRIFWLSLSLALFASGLSHWLEDITLNWF
jgi:hypothetical protein